MSYWICESCGAKHEKEVSQCQRCGHDELRPEDMDPGAEEWRREANLEWECTDCGERHYKNNPPCDHCGGMQFEAIYVDSESEGSGDVSPTPAAFDSTTQITGVSIFVYLVGISTFVLGALFVIAGQVGFGLPPAVAGLLVLPYFRKQLYHRHNVEFTGGAVAFTWFLAWVAAFVFYNL